MPRLVNKNPSYRKHRASGQAIVTIDGQDIYLGPHGTKASHAEYDRIIGEWLAAGRRLPSTTTADELHVADLIQAYWRFAEGYYDGGNNGEAQGIKLALRELRRLYGRTLVKNFGPLALKSVRTQMMTLDWARTCINAQIGRIRRMFRWGVEQELMHPAICQALEAVAGLRRGKTEARESEPVRPVPDAHVDAIKECVSDQVWAMIEFQRITGMRPAEVCAMRGCDLDTTGKLWTYKPAKHKTQHHGHSREVFFGPRGQEIVARFLNPNVEAYLFSPTEAEAGRRSALQANRKTPLNQGNRTGTNRRRRPGRRPGDQYTVAAYRRAIARGCEQAFQMPDEIREPRTKETIDAEAKLAHDVRGKRKTERAKARAKWHAEHVWHPHQLRHTAATRLRKEYGLEAAQVILGHKQLTVTQLYAEKNVEAARKIMGEVG